MRHWRGPNKNAEGDGNMKTKIIESESLNARVIQSKMLDGSFVYDVVLKLAHGIDTEEIVFNCESEMHAIQLSKNLKYCIGAYFRI